MKENRSVKKSLRLLYRFAKLKAYITNNYSTIRNKALVFLVFVVLASLLWYYRALDDTFIANISYPVRYQNLPKNKVLINTPPERISLRVRGNGYDLISSKLKIKTPLNFNINSFLFYSQGLDSMSVYILSQYAREALTDELNKKNAALEIVSISPDTILFSFTRTKAKKVAIKATILNESNIFAKQHMQNGEITLSPDSIEVIGPATILDTINYVYTKPIQPNVLTDSFRKKLKILNINQVILSQESTHLTIPVDKYTEISFDIPISSKHVPDSINMKLFPRMAKVSFNIPHSHIPKVTDTDFTPYIDYDDLISDKKKLNRISIKIDSVPPFVYALRIYPSSVEFIKELNNANSRNNRRDR